MRITPLDLQNHRFGHRLRGYDPGEVDDFVRMVAEDYESLVQESESLRENVRALELRVAQLSGEEGRLRDTMMTAQSLTEDLKRTAIREAEMRVGEAEVRAEKILDAAHRRLSRLQEEIRELRMLRSRVASAVRATLDTHSALLAGLLEESPDDADAAATVAPPQRPTPMAAPLEIVIAAPPPA